MDYPIIINERNAGTLTVTAEGAFTVFEARSEDPGGVVRLAVYGAGREGYLGVMTPAEGGLFLRKKFSRSALRAFPAEIEYAAPTGERVPPPPEAMSVPIKKREKADGPLSADSRRSTAESAPRPAADMSPGGVAPADAVSPAGIVPPAVPEEETELLWYQAGDGSLTTVWNGRQYRAFPLSAHGLPSQRMLEKRRIEDVDYAVFETKNGKII